VEIQLLRADTTSLKVDALVYPAEDGSAEPVAVSSGNFLCRFVIHVQVPKASEADSETKLRKATTVALERAEELAVASVGVPPIGTGFAAQTQARVMLAAALEFRPRARSLQRAVFCLFGQAELDTFQHALAELGG